MCNMKIKKDFCSSNCFSGPNVKEVNNFFSFVCVMFFFPSLAIGVSKNL